MRIVVAPRARREIANQLGYLVDQGAIEGALRLEARITEFLESTLVQFPGIGTPLGERNLREIWLPGTRLVIWYRIERDELQMVRVWHTAQYRRGSP